MEETAGIVLRRRNALLVGNHVFVGGNDKLSGSNDSYDRKDPKRNGEEALVIVLFVAKISVHRVSNRFGNIAGATAATAAVVCGFQNVYVKHNGVNGFNNRGGNALFLTARFDMRAEIGEITSGAENAGVAFAAIENDLLIKDCNALEFLCASVSDASLKYEFDVEADIYGIKASVKLNGIEADLCLSDAGALYSDCACMLNDLLSEVREKNLHVFKAVAVSARVKYSVGLYTNSFQAFAGAA
jgi:hypothetical protein